jgi:hypothetical protein
MDPNDQRFFVVRTIEDADAALILGVELFLSRRKAGDAGVEQRIGIMFQLVAARFTRIDVVELELLAVLIR